MFHQLKMVLTGFSKAFQYLRKRSGLRMILLTGLVNIALLIYTGFLAWEYSGWLIDYLGGYLQSYQEDWGDWIRILFALLIRVVMLLAFFQFYHYLVLIFMTPFFSHWNYKLCKKEENETVSFPDFAYIIGSSLRSWFLLGRNFIYECLLFLGLLLLSLLIPISAPIMILLMVLKSSFFYGYALMDIKNDYYGLSTKVSGQLICNKPWLAIGYGLIFKLVLLLPLLGFLLAPGYSMVACSLSYHPIKRGKA